MADEQPRISDILSDRRRRHNVRALIQYGVFVVMVVAAYTVLFQLIMTHVEGQRHDWVSAVYWTLSTMTTLGLGDIVFVSNIGRAFTAVVLLSGIVLVFIVLPFAFIRFFYAPWLQTRRVPDKLTGHVLITSYDNLAPALIRRLELHEIPYYVIEPDAVRASQLQEEGISVVTGEIDNRSTYERLRVTGARLVVMNRADTTNTNMTLTVREVAPTVPVAAVVDDEASIDVLELAGATHVLPLKLRLGLQLAQRMNAGQVQTHVIGAFRDLLVAEFPVHNTPFSGRTLREISLRETIGVNIVGVLEQTRFLAVGPDTRLTDQSVPVVIGSRKELDDLDEVLVIYDANLSPIIVIGGGKVGVAAARMLRRRGAPVHMIEKDEGRRASIGAVPDRLFIGDAAEREVLMAAGLAETPGVVITTNDDAMNIYLTVYCRRLAPEVRIVSRITHDRNMDAIRRAGADLALSHTTLGVESLFAVLRGDELVVLGEGVELHELAVPASLVGKTLGEAGIAARTGLNVIALQPANAKPLITNPQASTTLEPGSRLLMIGNQSELKSFGTTYE